MNTEPITFANLIRAIDDIQVPPSRLKLSQKTFNDFYDMATADLENVEVDKTKDRPFDPNSTVFGIRIVLDNRMKYGNWRFEK